MKDLHTLDHSELIDLLSRQTYEYTKMFRQGISQQQYESCRLYIKSIISEIESRKTLNAQTSATSKE